MIPLVEQKKEIDKLILYLLVYDCFSRINTTI